MKITLIRHAESEGNANPFAYLQKSDREIGLTERGEDQAKILGQQMEDFRLFVRPYILYSPFLRAKRTMEIATEKIAYMLQEVEEDPLLVERGWGELRTKVFERRHTPEDFAFFNRPIGGESFFDLYQRIVLFRHKLDQMKFRGVNHIVCFTHGEWIKMFDMVHKGLTIEQFERTNREWKVGNCEMLEFEL